ncbi:4-hydroxybenzoate--CoA ligase [Rhodoblastus sphagnicola]|uniref:4-hydroxybenzoate--CoA ligase n=1 Tax=Rhodoblastus sphagnicola TaxID=333368 RepID=A0A2S6MX30_9HYPH|nr:benzoate-CoA ligase family protein [Rhodoblastus sphagnicola]MBB4199255.1 4-hydroxybenzoate-CoA ligase [Rhodoblastus sphagnicola]PPQ26924.1 4-hydroxybenzoate--CoA ligase [Rhodoblastus sphagnicola]
MNDRDYNAAVDFVDRHIAEGRAEKIAFIDTNRSLTYGAMADSVSRVGPMLAKMGVEPENRVALVLLDTVDFPILFWGAIRAGVVPVLLNTRLTVEQYRYLLADSRAKAVFVSPQLLPAVKEASAGCPRLRALVAVGGAPPGVPNFETLLAAEKRPAEPAQTSVDEVAYWLYSSGTTGMPKGVMHVHGAPRAVAKAAGEKRVGYREEDVVFSAAKMFFSYGLSNSIVCTNWAGSTSVLYPERPTPTTVFETLNTYQPSIFFGVPTLYAAILADRNCTRENGSHALRLCFSAGEALPAHVGQAWKERFGVDIVNGVGSTEMGHLFVTNIPGAVEYGTAGVPVEGYSLKLVDEAGQEVGANEPGELWVRGETSAAGYWNQRARSRNTFIGEWTRTGDKYMRRDDGVYVLIGRTDDMFKVSGIWVSPYEVEEALASHPAILEAAVVPSQDQDDLIKPKAYVVLSEGVALDDDLFDDLKSHVKNAVGPWKYPRWIEVVPELPKTATGKLQRFLLR